MTPLEVQAQRDGGVGWIAGLLLALGLAAFAGTLRTPTVTATSPDLRALGAPHPGDLMRFLERASLPYSFTLGGLSWRAAQLVRLGLQHSLVLIGTPVEGYPVYHIRGAPTGAHRSLYMPAKVARRSGFYVRYERVP